MIYLLGLGVLLAFLAGVIAWAGDRLGTWAGRRRLTILGARPKRTGQVIGVLAGILIMVATLLVLALAFQNATQTLLNAQRTAQELSRLQAQERTLADEIERLDTELSALGRELEEARTTITSAEAARDAALAARDAAAAERDAIRAQSDVLRGDLASLEEDLSVTEADLADVRAARDAALAERDAAQAEVAVARAEVVQLQDAITVLEQETARLEEDSEALRRENRDLATSNASLTDANADLAARNDRLEDLNAGLEARIVDAGERAEALQAQVDDLTQRLEAQSRRLSEVQSEVERAASGDVTFEAGELIYSGSIAAEDAAEARAALDAFVDAASESTARRGAGEVVLRADQIAILVDAITATPSADLVRLLSPRNQFSPLEVAVVVEAFEDERVMPAGTLLVTREVHLGTRELPTSQVDLRTTLASLKTEALAALRRAGLDEFQLPRYPTLTEEAFAGLMLRRTGPVTIGVWVLEDVTRGGPADLEFVMLD